MDFMTGLPMTEEGYDATVVVTYKLTKQIRLIATTQDATAEDVAQLFLRHIV